MADARTWAAEIGGWTVRTRTRLKAVWQESIVLLVDIMQTPRLSGGNMPMRTGFLRASLAAGVGGIPPATREGAANGFYGWDRSVTVGVIRALEAGERIVIGYTAHYAVYVELRYGFQRLAVQEWPYIVNEIRADMGIRQ